MARLSFLLSRFVGTHFMRLTWGSAAVFFLVGLVGPRYSASLGYLTLLAAKVGVIVGMGLWTVVMRLRTTRPGFNWTQVIVDYASWVHGGFKHRAAWTLYFVGLAVFFICLGLLIGAILVYLVWRAM